MPKAPRRKHIRAARQAVDPTSRPEADSNNAAAAASNATPAPAAGKGKKSKNKDGQSKDKELLPVLTKLSSENPSDRLWAASAISHILGAADAGTRRALQSKNIVGLLLERLQDKELEVQVEATGALRNLAIEGGFEVCAEMFNKGAVQILASHLQPLNSVFHNMVIQKTSATEDTEKRIRKIIWTWTENVATLFWCLAETSDKAFKAIVAQSLLSNLLYSVLRYAVPSEPATQSKSKATPPLSVALAAAQAVYVLTDTNVPSAPKFPLPRDVSLSAAHSNTRQMLLEILRNASEQTVADSKGKMKESQSDAENKSMLVVLCVGILQNLSQQHLSGQEESEEEVKEFQNLALQILSSSLKEVDLSAEAANALQAYTDMPTISKTLSTEVAEASPQRLALDLIEKRWTRVRLTLEVLGELSAELDGIVDSGLLGSEEYEEWNGLSNGHENGDDTAMGEKSSLQDEQQKPSALSDQAMNVFAALPQLLLKLAEPTILSFAPTSALVKPAVAATEASDSMLISTQPEQQASSSDKQYIPNMTEHVSLVHNRALECLNNLLITLGRAGADDSAEKDGGKDVPADEDEMLAEDDSEEADEAEPADSSVMPEEDDDLPEDMFVEDKENESNDVLATYLSTNFQIFQSAWERLFQLLVEFVQVTQALHTGNIQSTASFTNGASNGKGKKKASSDEEENIAATCVEATLGSLWALGRLCINQLSIGSDETRCLLNVLQLKETGVINTDAAVRCIGALGSLAARKGVSVDENQAIGSAFFQSLAAIPGSESTAHRVEMTAQLLDTIFDVYGDEERDYDAPVFRKGGFLPLLERILPEFTKMTKSIDRRKYIETRDQADAALANLSAFIQYRKSVA